MTMRRPLVGIPADFRYLEKHPFHCVGNKYVHAVAAGADVTPLLLPALGAALDIEGLLGFLDGIVFTGSPSNIAPSEYGAELPSEELAASLDPERDATTLPLIRAALRRGVPILGICRGFQEMNVAQGGSLHQEVHYVPGLSDHREDDEAPLELQYGPAHEVRFTPGGLLARITGATHARVNSLHGQGVARLGSGLRVEALAPDGLIEAFTVEAAAAFALAVQWHPEWNFEGSSVSRAIFGAFGRACKDKQAERAALAAQAAGADASA
jgi:putative glutamine amidotransferase